MYPWGAGDGPAGHEGTTTTNHEGTTITMPDVVDLTDREWDLFQALRDRKTPQRIAGEWATTKQNVDNILRRLIIKGLVRRVEDIPWWTPHSERFPFLLEDKIDVRYKPLVPPKAVITAEYPPQRWGKLVVDPIRVVRWPEGGWVIQGLPTVRPDGQNSWERVPEDRIVWGSHQSGRDLIFRAHRELPWLESRTAILTEVTTDPPWDLDPEQRRDLTLCVAAAVGVPAVLDLTEVRRSAETSGTDGDDDHE